MAELRTELRFEAGGTLTAIVALPDDDNYALYIGPALDGHGRAVEPVDDMWTYLSKAELNVIRAGITAILEEH